MVIGAARVVIHIPMSRSLKDKRQVVKPLLAQAQQEFRLSAAEIEEMDRWQIAVIGLACVSTDAAHADEVIAKAVAFLRSRMRDAELLRYETETIHSL
jgi:uncharacterized protein YlxP (DUF503 family)